MCPRCGEVYNRELAEAFERIPSNQGWDEHGGNPNMYVFDKRGVPRRQDNPHPRAKRVTFKLPAEVPEDKWTQVGSKKGKWKSFEDGGRISWAYRKQFQASKREAIRLENYKGKNHMSRSQWRRHQRLRKAEREMT